MKLVKRLFDFYLYSSIHVALAAASLVAITYYYNTKPLDIEILLFVFLATFASYNLIKYSSYIARNRNFRSYKFSLKLIIVMTILALIYCLMLIFMFREETQLLIGLVGLLSTLYMIPLRKGASNLRNISGVKIYIVSLCWAIVTLLVPLSEEQILWDSDVLVRFTQRFILTLLLILIFEISDLKYDDIRLKTMPQAIGIRNTKRLIYGLSAWFFILDLFKKASYATQDLVNLILIAIVIGFTYYASPKRSVYYTVFWVESIPIIWLVLVYLLGTDIYISS